MHSTAAGVAIRVDRFVLAVDGGLGVGVREAFGLKGDVERMSQIVSDACRAGGAANALKLADFRREADKVYLKHKREFLIQAFIATFEMPNSKRRSCGRRCGNWQGSGSDSLPRDTVWGTATGGCTIPRWPPCTDSVPEARGYRHGCGGLPIVLSR